VSLKGRVELGLQQAVVHGARLFVLPNPSGRNANFTYAEMLASFRALKGELTQDGEHCRSSPRRRVSGSRPRQKQGRAAGAGSDR
jgi:hypothetical protein